MKEARFRNSFPANDVRAVGFALLLAFSSPLTAQSLSDWVGENCTDCVARMVSETGAYILEKGEEALIGRAWLTQHAQESINIQYFIWSTDNIGMLAAEQLLRAAERGVRVRVLVDDMLVDAEGETLLLLSAHKNVQIRIYNPNMSVGKSFFARIWNVFTQVRAINQRMHDKTAIFDGVAGITGSRNMADEYFDFDPEYNFRDRDILLLGPAVADMQENFEEFWASPLAVPVAELIETEGDAITDADARAKAAELHAYARDPVNFEPQVRAAIENLSDAFPALLSKMSWQPVTFISDAPGKNDGQSGLGGGGQATENLFETIRNAKRSILIQSPYLIMPRGGIELFAQMNARGVRIRILTNSLASTDNTPAFSGYHRQRPRLLNAGVELFEYKPHPGIQAELVERYPRLAANNPVFALHAKSMVIDDRLIYIGTFNLDPRSANLNTEVGVLIESKELARQLTASIERDMLPENSWRPTLKFAPDYLVERSKRLQLGFINLLPIEPLL
jgi:putative cardiolipin synthase